MISTLEIENFKAFSGKQVIDFAPITLIFGQNSSGKSSIIQSILALKQTLANVTGKAEFVSSGSCVDLGGFISVVNSHDKDKKIKLALSFMNDLTSQDYQDVFSEYPLYSSGDVRRIELGYVHAESDQMNDNILQDFDYSVFSSNLKNTKININLKRGARGFTKTLDDSFYGNTETLESFSSFISRVHNKIFEKTSNPITKWAYDSLSTGVYNIRKDVALPLMLTGNAMVGIPNSYLQRMSDEIKYEVGKVKYLGPLRTHPKRFYQSGKDSVAKTKGETNLGGELYEAGEKVLSDINNWLGQFEIPYDINVENIGNETTGNVISVILNDKRTQTLVTPADVGFGIGQVMPIITEAVVSKNATLCVEQPEIHLHPKLQAHLADLFIDSVNPKGRNNQWIIETHSESLMLRLQKRIREKRIDKKLIKVLYVVSDSTGSKIIDLPLDDDGDFTILWPEGFFEERLDDIFGV